MGARQALSGDPRGEHLDQHGETALTQLRQGTKLSAQLLLMGIGWLAKEGKLAFVKADRTLKISVKG